MIERRSPRAPQCPDPATWVDRYGDGMFRYALLRVRQRDVAEDLVQETLLAALRARDRFAGRCSFRSWLVAILKRKIIDHVRRARRQRSATDLHPSEDVIRNLFTASGRWRVKPPRWGDPAAALEQAEFWEVFRRCLRRLPEAQADAFSLRELEGLAGDAIRELLHVTAGNLSVLLHRARLSLWRCLTLRWFSASREEQ